MAKGKHAAALFEVIHADRRYGKKTSPADSLSTPKWWFKGKGKVRLEGVAPVAPAQSAPPPPVTAPVASDPQPIDYLPPALSDPAARQVDVRVNSDRQEINFKLTYTSAIVGGFALLVVLSLAYVIGRKMNAGPAAAVAATVSTNDLRKGAPQKGVMDLAKAQRNGVTSIAPEGDESAKVIDAPPTARAPAPPPLVKSNTAVLPFDGRRLVNQNYVVVQSWPAQEKEHAIEAAKLLNEANIGATVVQGLPGWQPTWFSVVGTMPFERTKNNPVYDAYKKSIMDVSAKYAGKTKWKRFEPMAKKWAGDI